LADLGVLDVVIAARRLEPADALARFARDQGLHARTVDLAAWASALPRLVVSTVPIAASASLVDAAPQLSGGFDGTLFDVAYVPWPSPLAAAVEAAGGSTISGIEMLIHQAVRQFELFTGVPGDLAAMQAAARSATGL